MDFVELKQRELFPPSTGVCSKGHRNRPDVIKIKETESYIAILWCFLKIKKSSKIKASWTKMWQRILACTAELHMYQKE